MLDCAWSAGLCSSDPTSADRRPGAQGPPALPPAEVSGPPAICQGVAALACIAAGAASGGGGGGRAARRGREGESAGVGSLKKKKIEVAGVGVVRNVCG